MDNVLERIYKSALKFLVPLTPEETYETIVKEAINLAGTGEGSIFLPDSGTKDLRRVYTSNPGLYKLKARKRGITYRTFKTRQAAVVTKKEIEQLYKVHPMLKEMETKSIVSVPLSYRNKSIGVLSLQSLKEEQFTQKELDVLKLFGSMASLAIRKTQLYDEIKKALETRDLFISMAAHELRTPLTTISGYGQLLRVKLAGTDGPESKWVEGLTLELFRLTQLVNELLEVNRIRSGEFQYILKECYLTEIIRRAISDLHFTHPNHKISLQNKILKNQDIVIADFDKLLQVIINIIDNSAKFSPTGSEITLDLKLKNNYLILRINDHGEGISKSEAAHVFERFYKGKIATKAGMGLGLFLARNVISKHNGEIKIYSEKNKGTIVEIKLPKLKND